MKTETTSGGMGKLILRLILSILLVFSCWEQSAVPWAFPSCTVRPS